MRRYFTQKVQLGGAKVWGLRQLGLQGMVWSERAHMLPTLTQVVYWLAQVEKGGSQT